MKNFDIGILVGFCQGYTTFNRPAICCVAHRMIRCIQLCCGSSWLAASSSCMTLETVLEKPNPQRKSPTASSVSAPAGNPGQRSGQ
jgi:hypothetical protein